MCVGLGAAEEKAPRAHFNDQGCESKLINFVTFSIKLNLFYTNRQNAIFKISQYNLTKFKI